VSSKGQNDITPPSDNQQTNGRHTLPLYQPDSEPPNDTPLVSGTLDDPLLGLNSPIDELKMTAQFIDSLHCATLKQSNMRQEDIE
jgi:hypothetical protein